MSKKRVAPCDGGCWFCETDTGEMEFTVEFDAYFHLRCLIDELATNHEQGWENREAEIIAREFHIPITGKMEQ